ncbi:MAG TPA: serine acetyltransferase, partial [Polyangiaceae bacterium]
MSHAFQLAEPAQDASGSLLREIVDALCDANRTPLSAHSKRGVLPSPDALAEVVRQLRSALFPWHFGAHDVSDAGLGYYVGRTLDAALKSLERQVHLGLLFHCSHGEESCRRCAARAAHVTREFATRLPKLRKLLGTD